MKTRFVSAWAIVCIAAVAMSAQNARNLPSVHINLDDPPPSSKRAAPVNPNAPAKPDAKATAKADPNATAKKDAKKKDDEPGKIDGMEIPHGDGFMGLEIKNGTFKLSFYDAKKKPVAPDVVRVALRWQPAYQRQPERDILTPSGKALTSEKVIRPPYQFKLFVTLFKTESDNYEATDGSVVNFTVDFSQSE